MARTDAALTWKRGAVSGALDMAWRTLAFGLNVGGALIAALARTGIGLLVGLLLFTFVAQLAPPDYRGLTRNVGAFLTGLTFGASAFLKAFREPGPSNVIGSAA